MRTTVALLSGALAKMARRRDRAAICARARESMRDTAAEALRLRSRTVTHTDGSTRLRDGHVSSLLQRSAAARCSARHCALLQLSLLRDTDGDGAGLWRDGKDVQLQRMK